MWHECNLIAVDCEGKFREVPNHGKRKAPISVLEMNTTCGKREIQKIARHSHYYLRGQIQQLECSIFNNKEEQDFVNK